MTSRAANRRQIKQLHAAQDRERQVNDSIVAADHYTAADRAIAEAFEASELAAAFIAEEVWK